MVPLLLMLIAITPFATSQQEAQVGLGLLGTVMTEISSCLDSKLHSFMTSTSQSILDQTLNLVDSRIVEAEKKMDLVKENCSEMARPLQQFMEEFPLESNELMTFRKSAESRMQKLEQTDKELLLETNELKEALKKSLARISELETECKLPTRDGRRISNGETAFVGDSCDLYHCVEGRLHKNNSLLYNTQCPTSYKIFDSLGCVKLIKEEKMSWYDARKRCIEDGTDLVKVNDMNDVNSLKNLLNSESFSDRVWIGFRRISSSWTWTQGGDEIEEKAAIWRPNEPSGDGICGDTKLSYDGKINDISCQNRQSRICQLPSV